MLAPPKAPPPKSGGPAWLAGEGGWLAGWAALAGLARPGRVGRAEPSWPRWPSRAASRLASQAAVAGLAGDKFCVFPSSTSDPPRPGSAGLAEWSGTQLQLRCWEGPGFKPRARDLGTAPARVQGEQPEVDRGKFPLELAAAGVLISSKTVVVLVILVILTPSLARGEMLDSSFLRFRGQRQVVRKS